MLRLMVQVEASDLHLCTGVVPMVRLHGEMQPLEERGPFDETELTAFLSKHYGVPSVNLDDFQIEDSVVQLLSREIARKHMVVPINRIGSSLVVAMSDPSNIYAIDELKFITNFNIEVVVASEVAIREAIDMYYADHFDMEEILADIDLGDDDVEVAKEEEAIDIVELTKNADEAPVIRLVNLILLSLTATPSLTLNLLLRTGLHGLKAKSPLKSLILSITITSILSTMTTMSLTRFTLHVAHGNVSQRPYPLSPL